MKRVRGLLSVLILTLLALGWTTAALGATISGAVTNASGQSGRIFLKVLWQGGNSGRWGVSIPAAGDYAIRGVPQGSFVVVGYVDRNGDGIPNISEAFGMSGQIDISGEVVSGSPDLTLFPQDPAVVVPVPAHFLEAMPFDGGVLLMWDSPQDDVYDIFTQADSFRVEWSPDPDFAAGVNAVTVSAGSGMDDDILFVPNLVNGTPYWFRVISIVGVDESSPVVATATPEAPADGHTISGTISLPPAVAVPADTPIVIIVEGVGGESVFLKMLPAFADGTPFSLGGVPDGYYHLHAMVDMNGDQRPSAGDYWTEAVQVTVAGTDLSGNTLTVADPDGVAFIEIEHVYGTPAEHYEVATTVESGARRPVNVYVTGPQYPAEGVDLAWDYDEAHYSQWADLRPQLSDSYSFEVVYADGTGETLTASPRAVYDAPVPNNVVPSGTITGMPGAITWTPSAPLPAGWVTAVNIWNDAGFGWYEEGNYPDNAVPYDGPPLAPGLYTLKVKFCEDWEWNCVVTQQSFSIVAGTVAAPATLMVPPSDADGDYTVTWAASVTPDVVYVLEEATDSTFSSNLRTAYSGTETGAAIGGRSQGTTYYYRVKATRDGFTDSGWRAPFYNGCAVPGTATVEAPASLTVPVADADGDYLVSWDASPTVGVVYRLQEATAPNFSAGARIVYTGTQTSAGITGRSQNVTYYYRVKAMKPGLVDSPAATTRNGCAVPGSAVVETPVSITVPVSDADGEYTISWGVSATPGVTYYVNEATDPKFLVDRTIVYLGEGTSVDLAGRQPGKTYYYRVTAIKPGLQDSARRVGENGCAVPGSEGMTEPTALTVPLSDADGEYPVSWTAAATTDVTYVLEEATDPLFDAGRRIAYSGAGLSTTITGRAQDVTYYYRVKAIKAGYADSAWRLGSRGCAVPGTLQAAVPTYLEVPQANADGDYPISWGGSATKGVTFVLDEATDPTFASNVRVVYSGPAKSVQVTGRSQGVTYYYRVRTVKAGLKDSRFRIGIRGCAVPGVDKVGAPSTVTVPATDADGAYTVSWTQVNTPGVIYLLEEATSSDFRAGLRIAYFGTALSRSITGRTAGNSYYYRVKTVKPGVMDSARRVAGNPCAVDP